MQGKFRLYAVGKAETKSGKTRYQFVYGDKPADPMGLLENIDTVDYWTERKLDLKFMDPVDAVIDIIGDLKLIKEIFKVVPKAPGSTIPGGK